ncbi:MAG: sigma-70 family RNA polymerase sigma factor [bacterium]|nr:sigma-70 family RNA polymerase sigma factor [bacterium]
MSPTPTIPLETLMAQAQAGDELAYAEVLRQCERLLHALMRSKVSDSEGLNDLIQECLISIHKARHTYQANRPFKPWMFAIANYRLKDHFRGAYRRLELEKTFLDHLTLEKETQDVTFYQLQREQLSDILEKLPSQQRQLVQLCKIEGYSIRETSQKMGMSESAVKVALHRCLKKITEQLSPADE